MKLKYIFYLILATVINFSAFSQNYTITWQRTIGGNNTDKLTRMLQTFDGGMILCGYSNSNISGAKAQNSVNNSFDFWLVKLNANGATQWTKTYGGSDRDLNPSIIQTQDSGYLISGSSISAASGSKTENAVNHSFDYWAIKLNKSGNLVWDNTIGGIQFEKLAAVLETSSGYFLCGSSNSTYGNDKTVPNLGSSLWPDYWIVKLSKSGVVLWDSTYGNTNRDELTTAKATSDGGLILAGSSYSPRGGTKKEDYIGNNDYWIIKLDSIGHRQWDRTIGGALSDYLTAMDIVGNIGYIFVGYSNSPAGFSKTGGLKGGTDYWVVRTDKSGIPMWDKTFGGSKEDYATSVKYLNGNFLIGGYSNSPISGDKASSSKGGMDFWTLRLDKNGNLLDQNTWGGKQDDFLVDYAASDTNVYLLAGSSLSQKSGNKTSNTVGNTGNSDYWIFKVQRGGTLQQTQVSQPVASDANKAEVIKNQLTLDINPNPVKDVVNLNYSVKLTQQVSISVYSNNGKLVRQQILSQSSGNYTVDLSAQPAGIYYAVLQSGTSSITKKFVKN